MQVLRKIVIIVLIMGCSKLTSSAAPGDGVRAVIRGDVRLGALFAVHGAPIGAGGRCGAVREHYGIQRVEATLQALDHINDDSSLLPGLVLGADLRDSCWAPPTALRQTIDLVRDAIAPPSAHAQVRSDAIENFRQDCQKEGETSSGKEKIAERAPMLGVLGPGASSAAVQVQNLLQLFSIPQVSYSATSRELSDRARFSTFFRVVPSDIHQARLMAALVRAHNWTYVHALYTDERYGQSGASAFRDQAARIGVCVAREEPLRATPTEQEIDAVLKRLSAAAHRTQVAVCWCEGRTARALLAGLARNPRLRLQLVASDGWADRGDVVAGLEQVARGALTLRIRSPYLAGFDQHYHALTPTNNRRNPWFSEFWEQKFNCSLDSPPSTVIRICTGNESLSEGYSQEPKLALVVRGVYALAHALHEMRGASCGADWEDGLCDTMLPFNVTLYRWHLQHVKFRAPDGGLVAFDRNGDPPPELSDYDVMRFTGSGSTSWRYERVGRWRRGALMLAGGATAAARRALGVVGTCGRACSAGEWARAGEGRARCCWTCVPCPPLAVTVRAGCKLCPPGHRPDVTRTVCVPSPVEWGGGGWAKGVAAAAGCIGLTIAVLFATAFWRHRTTPVVKSASRELCALLLSSAIVCHIAALAAATHPTVLSCLISRLATPALGGVYAAVLARTVRIARLVAAVEKRPTSRPRLLSSKAQIWLWAGMSTPGTCTALCAALYSSPSPRIIHPSRTRSVVACGGEGSAAQLLSLIPVLVLLLLCAGVAVRTRKLPHNFNETKFIGAAAYACCVAWAAFAPVWAGADSAAKGAALCACASVCAGTVVLLSLGPRVFVAVFRPQRNTRAHFLTTTSIRCHLGRYRPAAEEAVRSRDFGTQAGTNAWCQSCGPCARIVARPTARPDELEVVIALMQHHHQMPFLEDEHFMHQL